MIVYISNCNINVLVVWFIRIQEEIAQRNVIKWEKTYLTLYQ